MNTNINFTRTGKVLVVGDVMLDRYWKGTCSRVSPEAPVPVVKVTDDEYKAGGAANVAINISSLGIPCSLCGVIGQDISGHKLSELIEKSNINSNLLIEPLFPTITKLRIQSRNQQLIRLDFEKNFDQLDQDVILQSFRREAKSSKVIICSDYNKGTLFSIKKMISFANENGIPIIIDPKGNDFAKYENATLLTPNMDEFENIVGKISNIQDLENKAYEVISQYNIYALLITRSEDGMSLFISGQKPLHLPTHALEVFDVTGAGDTVIATIGSCLASDIDLVTSCKISNLAAGIVVGKLGTATVSKDELTNLLKTVVF